MKEKIFFLFVVLTLFFSCEKNTIKTLEREDLFSLGYGNFENQLNLFNDSAQYQGPNTHFFLNDGIFFISNAGGHKILKTSSYGDLLTLYYNAETNPAPAFADTNENKEVETSTHKAIEYPFNHCSFLSVSSNKHLYVIDNVPNDRIEFSHDDNIALTNVVLHFNDKGEFIDFIGQEGLGGTPFPNVIGVYTKQNNDIVVICRAQNSIKVFWYTENGNLLYKIPIYFDSLPNTYDSNIQSFLSLDNIVPSYDTEQLYLKIDYYVENIDKDTGVNLGINYDKSSFYSLNIDKGEYEFIQDIPKFISEETDTNDNIIEVQRVYQFLGIASNWCFLSAPSDSGYTLLMQNIATGKKNYFNLEIPEEDILYSTFNITHEGKLSLLMAKKDTSMFSIWHTEKFIK